MRKEHITCIVPKKIGAASGIFFPLDGGVDMLFSMKLVTILACLAFVGPAAAQGMGSGPIQSLPWAAKQRPHPGGADKKQGAADAAPQDVPHEAPISTPEPKTKKD